MTPLEFLPGDHISQAAEKMVDLVRRTGRDVAALFNGISLVATKSTTPSDIVAFYNSESERRAREFRESPEGKAEARRNELDVIRLQAMCDRLVADLPETLDSGNLSLIINWLTTMQESSDRIGVKTPGAEIIRQFHEHGFEPGVNCGPAFNGEDRENFARWLIGQALDCLQNGPGIHPIVHKFAKTWRNKFGG